MFSVFFYLRFQSWVLSAKSNQHNIFYKMEMPRLLLDHQDDSSGQQLTSLFSPFQQWTGSRLYAGWEQPSLNATNIFPVPSLLLHSLLLGAHTARQRGRRASGALERLQTGAGSSCHQSSEAGLQHKPLGQSEVGAVSYFGSGHPFPGILFPRISPLAVTSLSVQHSRVVVGSRNRAVLWLWEVVLSSLLLPVGWAVWGCTGQAPASKMPWFHL